jgi:heme exporter protein C
MISRISFALLIITAIAIGVANYLVFIAAPNEQLMGPVQRIFYFHVGAAIASYVAVGMMLVGAFAYLATRSARAIAYIMAGSEVAFLFATIVLCTGMIWGHAAWNTWFRWEPRLVTFLVLWLLLGSMQILKLFTPTHLRGNHLSIMAIITAINIPLVIFSMKLLPQTSQLHPEIIERQDGLNAAFINPLIVAVIATVLLQITLTVLVARIQHQINSRES